MQERKGSGSLPCLSSHSGVIMMKQNKEENFLNALVIISFNKYRKMPRVRLRIPKSEEDNGVEIRISKAIQAVRTGQEPSMRRAAEVSAVPYSTLRGRSILGRKRLDFFFFFKLYIAWY